MICTRFFVFIQFINTENPLTGNVRVADDDDYLQISLR